MAERVEFPTILDFPATRLKAYPRKTVVAEKFQAMVMLALSHESFIDVSCFFELAHPRAASHGREGPFRRPIVESERSRLQGWEGRDYFLLR